MDGMAYLQIFQDKAELLEPFTREEKGELLEAMLSYAFSGVEPVIETNARYIWPVFRQMIDASRASYQQRTNAGRNGGRPKKSENNRDETEKNRNESEENRDESENNREKSEENREKPLYKNQESRIKNQDTREKNQEPGIMPPPNLDTVEVIDTGNGDFDGGGSLAAYLSNNLLPMSPGNWAALNEIMSQGITEALVCYAVDIATANGKRTWGYVQGILNGWIVAGVRTVGEAKAEHEARKRQGGPPGRMSAGAAFGELARKYALEEAAERDESGNGGDSSSNLFCLSSPPVGGF